MPFDGYFDDDWETSQDIDEIWEPGHWELAAKLTGDQKILSLAEIIRFKLYQARFSLKNILNYDPKVNGAETAETGSGEITAAIIQCELDSLLFVLNRMMDLLALMITIIYGIQVTHAEIRFQDFFPRTTGFINSKSFLFFNELKRKDSILAGQLSAFYFSAENKLLAELLHKSGFPNPAFPIKYEGHSVNHQDAGCSESPYPKREAYIFHAGSVIQLEKAYREAACKFGRIIFNHLNYEPILAHYFPGYQPVE
jgi:hypothetical protein